MATIEALWAGWDRPGLEHLRLRVDGAGARADSVIIAIGDDGRPFRARFAIETDAAWRVRHARIELLGDSARALDLHADGLGHWTDAVAGPARPLDGCLDIDVYPSPFTNTLPIRRLPEIGVDAPVSLAVAYVTLPELTIRPTGQEYTLLERRPGGARWRFRSLDRDFSAELAVDEAGLVRDYPGIARRLR
ncbi:MAG TPA: putative glycolipid-binding domain-containing protein [Methylomirabilota bacterium]|nr:putative glycolipid-binding domain-containing protein [Methylomirabilota bacterium]